MIYKYVLFIFLTGFTTLLNAAVECSISNHPDGCFCSEESHPTNCKVSIPTNDPWYIEVANWAKDNVSYTSNSAGLSWDWKYFCGNDTCIKATDIEGNRRKIFYVNENINFDTATSGLETNLTDSYYGVTNFPLKVSDGYAYDMGWAYHGTYLDSSCHSKLNFSSANIEGTTFSTWGWTQEAGCNSVGYATPLGNVETTYSYSQPGIYWVGVLPIAQNVLSSSGSTLKSGAGVERLVIVDENGCIYGQCLSHSEIKYGENNLAWLVPVISLILN